MLETPQDTALFREWLKTLILDVSDVDPTLLSEYVLAILGAQPRMSKEVLTTELAEFLDDQAGFVATSILDSMRTNAYRTPLPKPMPIPVPPPIAPPAPLIAEAGPSQAPPGINPIPVRSGPPANAPSGPRTLNHHTSSIARSRASGLGAAGPGPASSGQAASNTRRDRDRGRDRDGNARRSASPSRVMLVDGNGNTRGSGEGGSGGNMGKKALCRDYHERGYCPRGMSCVFEHSEDSMYAPLPPTNPDGTMAFPVLQNIPGLPLLPNGMPDVAAFMAMNGLNGMGGQGMGGMQGRLTAGSPSGGANGGMPRMIESPMGNIGSPELPVSPPQPGAPMDDGTYSPHQPAGPPPPPQMPSMTSFPPGMFPNGMQMPFGMPMMGGFPPGPNFTGGRGGGGFGRGGGGGRGGHARGGPNGHFGGNGSPSGSNGDAGRFAGSAQPPKDRGTTTLVLTGVPRESLSVEAIQAQFKKHGTVTNVAVEASQQKALVSFLTNAQAFSAWRDPEPVFGNRHVKVLWHRPTGDQGAAGQAKLAASAALLENMRKIEEQGVEAVQGTRMTPAQIRQQVEKVKRNGLELEKILAEQKILMARLTNKSNPISAEEKPVVKARLKELSLAYGEMKEAHQKDNEILASIKESQEKTKNRLEAIKAAQKEAKRVVQEAAGVHAMGDLMNVDAPAEGGKEADEDTVALRAKLAALRQEAISIGLDPIKATSDAPAQPFVPHGRRILDNRPTALLLTPTGGEALPENATGRAKQHYEGTLAGLPQSLKVIRGEKIVPVRDVRLVEDGKKALVSFGNRAMAEAALRSGTLLPHFPSLSISWHAAPTDIAPTAPSEDENGSSATVASAAADTASAMDGVEVEYKRGEREDDE